MKQDRRFWGARVAFNVALLLSLSSGFATARPVEPNDDNTPGFYTWRGGSGSVTDGDNWDPDDSGPPSGSVPGAKDGVSVDTFDSITLTGNLTVKTAGLFGYFNGVTNDWAHITMAGTVTVGSISARDTTFQENVNCTVGAVSAENVEFDKDVIITGTDPFGPGDSLYISSANHPGSVTEFVAGSSLSATGVTVIDDAGHSFSDPDLTTRAGHLQLDSGVTAIAGPAGTDFPAFKVTANTALVMTGNAQLGINGGSYIIDGDARIGLGLNTVDFVTTSQINITDGGSLTVNGDTAVGFTDAGFSEKAGQGMITVDGVGSDWEAKGDILLGAEADCTGTALIQNGGNLRVSDVTDIRVGAVEDSFGTLTFDKNGGANPSFTFGGSTAELLIGDAGIGHFFVQGGADIQDAGTVILGNQSTGLGDATIKDGSKFTVMGDLIIGLNGKANQPIPDSVLVTNGATLTDDGAKIELGQNPNSTGLLTIDGSDSKVMGTGAANIVIGDQGKGVVVASKWRTIHLAVRFRHFCPRDQCRRDWHHSREWLAKWNAVHSQRHGLADDRRGSQRDWRTRHHRWRSGEHYRHSCHRPGRIIHRHGDDLGGCFPMEQRGHGRRSCRNKRPGCRTIRYRDSHP